MASPTHSWKKKIHYSNAKTRRGSSQQREIEVNPFNEQTCRNLRQDNWQTVNHLKDHDQVGLIPVIQEWFNTQR